jgi:hypothetical protein
VSASVVPNADGLDLDELETSLPRLEGLFQSDADQANAAIETIKQNGRGPAEELSLRSPVDQATLFLVHLVDPPRSELSISVAESP